MILMHLQALQQEEARFYADWLILARKLVLSLLDPFKNFSDADAWEGCHAGQKLEEHAAERPRINFVVVHLAHQYLGRLVKWGPNY